MPLEEELAQAFPASSRKLWDLIYPTGKVRTQVSLRWVPGSRPDIVIPEATITEGSLEVKSFPFSLDHVTATVMYGRDIGTNQDRLSIVSFDGHHDETLIRADDPRQCFVLCPSPDDPVGEWRVHLGRLMVEGLVPDRTLRRALPTGLRNTVKALDPQGKMDLSGMVELRGARRVNAPITAAWNIRSTLTDATLTAGVKLDHIHGTVISSGQWNGRAIDIQGKVKLASVYVLGHQFANVQGPFQLNNQELLVGAEQGFAPLAAGARERPIPNEER